MMANLFLVLVAIALLHFLYDGIVAPSIRLRLRFRLFALRDDLRSLRHGRSMDLDDVMFSHLHESLNTAIQIVPLMTIRMMQVSQRAIEADENLRNRIDAQIAQLDACPNQEARRIWVGAVSVVRQSYLVNGGGWALYLVPAAVVVASIAAISRGVASLLSVPMSDLSRVFPDMDEPRAAV